MTKSTVKPALKRIEEKLDTVLNPEGVDQKSKIMTTSEENSNWDCKCNVDPKENNGAPQHGTKRDD